VEGLEQCGDTAVPRVVVARRLKIFLEDDLEQLAPPATTLRIVAHPRALDGERESPRVHELHPPMHSVPEARRLLVAIGPEGGWQEPYELEMLKKHGFATVTLGERVLRSDVAVSVLLGLAHDWLAKNGESPS
jgi:16S rRNA (uracil1498-N3)-methyltransferase